MLLSRERNNSIERVNEANNNRGTTVLKGQMRIITTAAVVLEGPGRLFTTEAAMLEGTKRLLPSGAAMLERTEKLLTTRVAVPKGPERLLITKNSLGRGDRATMLLPGRDVCSKRINSANWSSAEWVRVAFKSSSKL